MAGRPRKRPAAPESVPGGRYVAKQTAGVVRKRLEDSMKPDNVRWVTITVTGDQVRRLTVCVISLSRTTAVCVTRENRVAIFMLGERNEADKRPTVLLDS